MPWIDSLVLDCTLVLCKFKINTCHAVLSPVEAEAIGTLKNGKRGISARKNTACLRKQTKICFRCVCNIPNRF